MIYTVSVKFDFDHSIKTDEGFEKEAEKIVDHVIEKMAVKLAESEIDIIKNRATELFKFSISDSEKTNLIKECKNKFNRKDEKEKIIEIMKNELNIK